jgi:hypothetical protein
MTAARKLAAERRRDLRERDVDAHGVRWGGGAPHAFLRECRDDVVAQVAAWISLRCAPRAKLQTRGPSSYGLKHIAECELGIYVANGEFIAGAIRAGFRARAIDRTPNARFDFVPRRPARPANDNRPRATCLALLRSFRDG